ncbi:MAG TPA: nucleotide pyrophosphohydrolase [Bacteroidales bacterium]|nr:nucleotide pyrophosphohydrolase [Bacteroidales bacterium]
MATVQSKELIKKNPFYRDSWYDQNYPLTCHRQEQLKELLGKTVDQIASDFNENEGKYVAYIAIRWGFAILVNNILTPTEIWHSRSNYDGFGNHIDRAHEIDALSQELIRFRDERHWQQFHNSKDLALAISIEAAELNELFLWKTVEEAEKVDREKLKEELADVFAFALLLAEKHDFDVKEIVLEKIRKNNEKYPVEKSRGTAKKYNEL